MKLAAIRVPGEPHGWERLGFAVEEGAVRLANGALELGADEPGLVVEHGSSPSSPSSTSAAEVEGIPVAFGAAASPVEHPNGAIDLDHLVIMTPDLDRTSAEIERALGLERRRLRETAEVRQAFHRFGRTDDGVPGCIVELVERPELDRPRLWGVVIDVADLDAFAASSDHVGEPRHAVQPGRRIATVRRTAGLGLAVAVMSREP